MKNPKILYRNGKIGYLLTTDRPKTNYCMLTMDQENGSIFHHSKNGKYLGYKEKMDWDIVWQEAEY